MVVLLMLIPLLAPSDSGALGLSKIAKALGVAALKALVAIVTIIAGGRTLLRPLYRRIAAMENNEIFAATTLLVVLGTSVLTQIAGLSLALGAFLVRPCCYHAAADVKSEPGAECSGILATITMFVAC